MFMRLHFFVLEGNQKFDAPFLACVQNGGWLQAVRRQGVAKGSI